MKKVKKELIYARVISQVLFDIVKLDIALQLL